MNTEPEFQAVTLTYYRKWTCIVFTSGYHNGCQCDPSDPHDGWGCGYYWTGPRLTDDEMRKVVEYNNRESQKS